MAGVRPEAGAVDQRLRVLDAKADRERLGFEVDAALRAASRRCRARCAPARGRRARRRSRAAARRQARPLRAAPTADGEAAHRAAVDAQVDDARAEADLAAEPLDLVAHVLDHADQPERADVRLGDVADLLGRAGADELVDHLARQVARVADLAPELAVGEGAGAALAELHVRLRIEDAAPPQAPGVLGALAHGLAALEDDRPEAHLREEERGEDAARAEADHDRSRSAAGGEVGRRVRDEAVARCRAPAERADRRHGARGRPPRRRPRSRSCRRRRSPPSCARRSRAGRS